MSDGGIHSTGRGGAGNIGYDPNTVYTDGAITREAPLGQPSRGSEYSTGRGGAGNVIEGEAPVGAIKGQRAEQEYVPEVATRDAGQAQMEYHTGRGGQGNVHKDKYDGHSVPGGEKSVGERVKSALGMGKKEEK